MIPNFALLLSEEGIALLHRSGGIEGWEIVDEISLEIPDLPTGMRHLCDTANRLSKDDFTTKVLLPKSQLLYAEITVSENADADIRAALEDRTPYTAEQLIYDSSGSEGHRKIVAVARDTLEEATGFIAQFGFNPTGFSTIPPEGTFDGEPNLGDFQTATFVPDDQAVVIVAPSAQVEIATPVSEPIAAPTPEPEVAPKPTPKAAPKPVSKSKPKAKSEAKPEIETPAEAASTTPAPAAFSSRRQGRNSDADLTSERLTRRAPRIAIPEKDAKTAAPKVQISRPEPNTTLSPPKAPSADRAMTKASAPATTPAQSSEDAVSKPFPIARLRREKPETPKDSLAALAAKQNAGKPRFLGLILTAVLVVALGLFAILSSYLLPEGTMSSWFNGPDDTPVEVVDVAQEEASDLEEFNVSQLPVDADLPSAIPELDTTPIDTDPSDIVQVIPTDNNAVPIGPLDATNAQTAYAVTGIWQRAPDFGAIAQPDTLDDLYIASLDPNPTFEDAPTLPSQNANSGDTRQAAPKAPPPPGVRYDLDDRGLVRPTADGALSPEGVIVFLGSPPIAPVQRDNTSIPSGLTPAIIDETESEVTIPEQPSVQIAAPTGPFADPALARFKPRQRPSDLSDRIERAQLGGNTRRELARLRPNQRPQAILDQVEIVAEARAAQVEAEAQAAQAEAKVRADAQAASIAAALAEAELSAVDQERAASLIPLDESLAPTALAIASSRVPPARPRGFENVVTAARQAPPQTQTASAARGSGPAVVRSSRVRPSGPTAGTVARAATDNNAISLGQVALVGVFGTSSSRRALVRLPSGRFKKVSVGDRVDGGRVAAIGASELKYTKSGRTLTLNMPNS